MLNSIINAILPIFFVIFVGWIAGKKEIIQAEHKISIIRFVTLIALPILLFNSTATTPSKNFTNYHLIIIYIIGFSGIFFINYFIFGKLFNVNKKELSIASLTSSFPNITFMGIPVLLKLYGHESMVPIIILTILASIILVPVTIMLIEGGNEDKKNIFIHIKNLLFTPMIFAPILGLIFSFFNIKLPDFFHSSLSLIGDTAPAISLFTIGVGMAYSKLKITKEVIFLVFSKNIIMPILFLGLLFLFKISGRLANEILVITALPSATMASMLAGQYDSYETVSTTATIIGTIFSIVTLGILLFLINLY